MYSGSNFWPCPSFFPDHYKVWQLRIQIVHCLWQMHQSLISYVVRFHLCVLKLHLFRQPESIIIDYYSLILSRSLSDWNNMFVNLSEAYVTSTEILVRYYGLYKWNVSHNYFYLFILSDERHNERTKIHVDFLLMILYSNNYLSLYLWSVLPLYIISRLFLSSNLLHS